MELADEVLDDSVEFGGMVDGRAFIGNTHGHDRNGKYRQCLGPGSSGHPGWTIDDLFALAGVPTRTIREYRTVGVLGPPVKRGRVGIYGRDHLERLRLVGRLQARGYSLAGIRDLIDAWSEGRSLGTVLALDEPGPAAVDEAPVSMTAAELVEAVPGLADPELLGLAARVGLVLEVDGRYAVRSPALLRLVSEATSAGAALPEVLDFVSSFRAGARAQAEALTQLVVDQLWDPDADGTSMEPLARRARLLLAQAAASLVVDELGRALAGATAPDGRGLDQLAAGTPDRGHGPVDGGPHMNDGGSHMNQEQRQHWNSAEAQHWVTAQDRYDRQLQPFADAVIGTRPP